MTSRPQAWLVAPLLLLLASCPKASHRADPLGEFQQLVRGRMHKNLEYIEEARRAVIRGELDEAREVGRRLATLPRLDDPPISWVPRIAAMNKAVVDLKDARDLTTAAIAIGRLGATCQDCHSENGVGPRVPKFEPSGRTDMRRHSAFMDRMWIAFIAADGAEFRRASKSLGQGNYRNRDPRGMADKFSDLDMRVHELGKQGTKAKEGMEQAVILAKLLATCANCHTTLGVGPKR